LKIAVINTGGTISCVGNPLAPMTSAEFKAACQIHLDPIIHQKFPGLTLNYVTDLAFPESASGMLDSTNLQPSDWCLIARYILEHYTEADGWVILHGTDTLDFSGTALPMLLSRFDADGNVLVQLSKSVILTGSQVPLFHAANPGEISGITFHTDAFENVCGAVAVARLGIPAVSVFFDNQLMRGSRVVKDNTSQFRAFASPNFPVLGQYGITLSISPEYMPSGPASESVSLDDAKARAATLNQLEAIAGAINNRPVTRLGAFPSHYDPAQATAVLGNLIRANVEQGIGGLVLESYGAGNFPSGNANTSEAGAIYQALDAANKAGVVIVDNTQVAHGAVDYNAYAAGAWFPTIGALNPVDMTPMASLAKLTILLAAQESNGWSLDDIKFLMQTPLVGEMEDLARLDSRTRSTLLPGQALTTFNGSASLLNDPERGPILKNSNGKTLWAMLDDATHSALPGQLRMQNDGNLVFYSRNNQPLWESSMQNGYLAFSQLRLRQTADGKQVTVSIYCGTQRATIWHKTLTL
jgi:L-asparaginase